MADSGQFKGHQLHPGLREPIARVESVEDAKKMRKTEIFIYLFSPQFGKLKPIYFKAFS